LLKATRQCAIGEPEVLAEAAQSSLGEEETYHSAQQAAWKAGEERENWDVEQQMLLSVASSCLSEN